jgi:SAM-dependent methyltransferase
LQREQPDWNECANLGVLRAVIDPLDERGVKNDVIDRLQWLAIRPHLSGPGRILDIGCGTGRMARRLVARGFEYTGVDASEKMVEAARNRPGGPGIRFERAASHATPFGDGEFDACLTIGVYQYLIHGPQGPATVAEVRRLLKPSGRLVMVEQASLSGATSGTVAKAATVDDYVRDLSAHFDVDLVRRARSGVLSRLTGRVMRFAHRGGPLRDTLVGLAARLERMRTLARSERYFRRVPYFDILIVARPRASGI